MATAQDACLKETCSPEGGGEKGFIGAVLKGSHCLNRKC